MNKPIIIIPAYQPNHELVSLVNNLTKDPDQRIILVDDGSSGGSRDIIDKIEKDNQQVEVLHHAINLGKSKALRTGFNQFLLKYSKKSIGVVTLDADERFSLEDIHKISDCLQQNPEKLIIGTEHINQINDKKNQLITRFSKYLFIKITGLSLDGNATDLRGIPANVVHEYLNFDESDRDFEMEMLIKAVKNKHIILEIPIQTINKNQYNVPFNNIFRDSTKTLFVFLRFSVLSISTAVIDFLIFSLSFLVSNNIFLSIVIARFFAGLYQFSLGKFVVFRSSKNMLNEIIRYVFLVVVLMLLSYGVLTPMVVYLKINTYLAKVIAEGTIFLLSFAAQKLFVFSNEPKDDQTNWDSYYNSPVITSPISRKFTERKLIKLMDQFHAKPISSICELGGGNSCFYPKIREHNPKVLYTIVDNNQRGLDLFVEQHRGDLLVNTINDDVIHPQMKMESADIVFSIGLIEHFAPENTAKAIQTHFKIAKPGSIVIITYPTPTWLYKSVRSFIELFGAWMFPDERPLTREEVVGVVSQYAEIVHYSINWPIVFTQGIIVARVKATD